MTQTQKRLMVVSICYVLAILFIAREAITKNISFSGVFDEVYFMFFFLLPAMFANGVPVLLRKVPFLAIPIAAKWFGKNKTWRGFLGACVVGTLSFLFLVYTGIFSESFLSRFDFTFFPFSERVWAYVVVGFSLGFGAIMGDLVKSFIKRKYGIPSGESFIPWDQIDYILGIGVATLRCYPWTLTQLIIFCMYGGIISFLAHFLAYWIKLIDTNK